MMLIFSPAAHGLQSDEPVHYSVKVSSPIIISCQLAVCKTSPRIFYKYFSLWRGSTDSKVKRLTRLEFGVVIELFRQRLIGTILVASAFGVNNGRLIRSFAHRFNIGRTSQRGRGIYVIILAARVNSFKGPARANASALILIRHRISTFTASAGNSAQVTVAILSNRDRKIDVVNVITANFKVHSRVLRQVSFFYRVLLCGLFRLVSNII